MQICLTAVIFFTSVNSLSLEVNLAEHSITQ